MQTGEYRGFVGQFSVWLREQVMTWRLPLLASLCLHVLFFWPRALPQNDFMAATALVPAAVKAHLRPPMPVLPDTPMKHEAHVRHAAVTQSSSEPVLSNSAVPRAAPAPVEAVGEMMQASAGLDAGAVRAYRIAWARALAGSTLRERLSPDMQGMLEIGVALAESGQLRDIAVLKGSGDAALDRAVLAAMRNVMQAVPIPSAMLGRELVLTVPVEVGIVATTAAVTSAADR